MSSQVQSFYKNIIEEVISKCTPSFLDCGFEESTIRELQSLWEQKLQNSGTTSTGMFDRVFENDLSKFAMQLPHNMPTMMGNTGMGVPGMGYPSFPTYGKPPTYLPNAAAGPINPMMMYPQTSATTILPNTTTLLNQQYYTQGLSDRAIAVPVPGAPLRMAPQPSLVSRDQLVTTNTDSMTLASTLNAQIHQIQPQQRQIHHDTMIPITFNQRIEDPNIRVPPSSGLSLGLLNQTQPFPTSNSVAKPQTTTTSLPTIPPALSSVVAKPANPLPKVSTTPPSPNIPKISQVKPSSSPVVKPSIQVSTKPPLTPPTISTAGGTNPAMSTANALSSSNKKTAPKSDWMNLKQQMNQSYKKTDEIRKTQQQANSEIQQQQAAAAAQQQLQQLQQQQQQQLQQRQQQAAAGGGSDGSDEEEVEEDEDLNSKDDESDDSAEPETDNLVVCTFDKVSRVKNKWKISLKCGVMNLNGKDYLFNRATGEGEW